EETAVGALGRRGRHAEDPFLLSVPAPVHLLAARDDALAEHFPDERAEVGRLGEHAAVLLAAALEGELQDFPARLVQLDDAARRVDGEEPGRKVAGKRSRRGFQVVGPLLLAPREAFELPLLLVERADRGLETRNDELALVAVLAAVGRSASRGLE